MPFLHCSRDVIIGDLGKLTTVSENEAGDISYV
jgi:hypothetical protein